MTQPTEQTDTAEDSVPEDQPFGLKHVLAILFAAGVTILIYVFRDQLQSLDKLAYLGAFLAMLIGNATVILPVPGLIFVFALGSTLNPLLVGLIAGPGAALGEMTGYFAGYGGSALIDNFKLYRRIERWMHRYGLIVITLLAAVPNPAFDMAGIVAGGLRVGWWRFLIAAWIGKTIQGVIVACAGALSITWIEAFLK
jgi:uncharacterized membrane protein YdjX (TVP38/TMEM64 family)